MKGKLKSWEGSLGFGTVIVFTWVSTMMAPSSCSPLRRGRSLAAIFTLWLDELIVSDGGGDDLNDEQTGLNDEQPD